MTNANEIEQFALAGNARLTLRSTRTGTRFSYRIRKAQRGNIHFVGLLTGPDNDRHYQYLGVIRDGKFYQTVKSEISPSALGYVAFDFFWRVKVHPNMEVWHEGKCGRCARPLTVPESIARGIGPECAGLIEKEAA